MNGKPAKIVVWEHNSHIGDARATEIGQQGEWNVGQLARERYGDQAMLIGFTTYHGTVTAASDWDAPARRKHVRSALAGSYEEAFHQTGIARFMLPLRDRNPRQRTHSPNGGWNAPSAWSTCRKASAKAIIFMPNCRSNSTPCCISIRPMQSSLWR
jgi:erythromycin esterase-like protein